MRAALIALLSLALVPAAALAAPPTVSITGPPDGAEVRADFVIGTATSDDTVRVEFFADGTLLGEDADEAGGFTLLVEDLPAGEYVLTAKAYNATEDATSAPVDITVDDEVSGAFTGATPGEGSTTKAASITIEFTETDVDDGPDDVTTECRIDDAATYSACTSPLVLDSLGDGTHTVRVRFIDDVGNVSAPIVRTFKVDRTAPVLTVTSPAEGAIFNATAISPGYQVTDAGGSAITVSCSLDGGAFGGCTFPATEGTHTLVVRAEDTQANRSEVTRTFTVDKTVPAISSNADVNGDAATITWTASDATALTFTCSLDGRPAAPCTSGITYKNLSDGEHAVMIRARDAAGNERAVHLPFLIGSNGGPVDPGGKKKRRFRVVVPRRVDKSAAGNRMRIRVRTRNKKRCVLRLVSAGGDVVIRKSFKGFRKYRVTLLLAKVEPGDYTVRVRCGSRVKRKKVTITA